MLARQVDYDALFKSLVEEEGLTVSEACQETYNTFTGDGQYNTGAIFAYADESALQLKTSIMEKMGTIVKAAEGKDSFVNANFAFQGLQKLLTSSSPTDSFVAPWRMLESFSFLNSLLSLLHVESKSEEEEEDENSHGEEDSDDDTEEHISLQLQAVLNMILFYLEGGSKYHRFRDMPNSCLLSGDQMEFMVKQADEHIQDKRVFVLFIKVLTLLCSLVDQNKMIFQSAHGDALLDLGRKMYKKNDELLQLLKCI